MRVTNPASQPVSDHQAALLAPSFKNHAKPGPIVPGNLAQPQPGADKPALAQTFTPTNAAEPLPARPLILGALKQASTSQKNAPSSPHSPAPQSRPRRAIDGDAPKEQLLIQELKPDNSGEPGSYSEASVDADPGKGVGQSQKVETPVELGINIDVNEKIEPLASDFKNATQEASIFLKKTFKEKWDLDIDPDNTYLTTFDYNKVGKEPYPAKIIQRISLSQALIENTQDIPNGKGVLVPHVKGGGQV